MAKAKKTNLPAKTELMWWEYEEKAKQLMANIESLEEDLVFLDGDYDDPEFIERFNELASNEAEFKEVSAKLEEAQCILTWSLLNSTKPTREKFENIKRVYEKLRKKFETEENRKTERILSIVMLLKQKSFETSLFKVSLKMTIGLEIEDQEEVVGFLEKYLSWERRNKSSEELSDDLLAYGYQNQDIAFLSLCDVKYSGTYSRGVEKSISIPLVGDKSAIKYLKANNKYIIHDAAVKAAATDDGRFDEKVYKETVAALTNQYNYETPGTFDIVLGEVTVKVTVKPGLHITNRVKPEKELSNG